MSLKEIRKLFNMDYTAVSQAVKRFEDKTKRDKETLAIKEMFARGLKKD